MKNIRVRYAPSPTGLQHIGGIRTALFNYFFAKANNGSFILRIEDTDQNRYFKEAEKDLISCISWLGIEFDEGPDIGGELGPYRQSERLEIYWKYISQLIEEGKAYKCYCDEDRLFRLRQIQAANKLPIGYDGHCRNLTENEISSLSNKPYVVRFKIEDLENFTFCEDKLAGEVKWSNKDINPDPILLKSDRFPTYHFANIIDDHLMEITHVLRAKEWFSSLPLHVNLYKAFNWNPPVYCHLPMIMGNDGQKLSKRHGSTSMSEFIKKGYQPEAIINYLVLLGWSHDSKTEFFTKNELKSLFSLDKLNKAPAIFDIKKLDHFNGHYLRKKSIKEFEDLVMKGISQSNESLPIDSGEVFYEFLDALQSRVNNIAEATDTIINVYKGFDEKKIVFLFENRDLTEICHILNLSKDLLKNFFSFDNKKNNENFKKLAKDNGLKISDLFLTIRKSLFGKNMEIPLIVTMKLLGEKEISSRLCKAMHSLNCSKIN